MANVAAFKQALQTKPKSVAPDMKADLQLEPGQEHFNRITASLMKKLSDLNGRMPLPDELTVRIHLVALLAACTNLLCLCIERAKVQL